eukprot:TRINITY_DN11281_c0_g1_i1.p1 TRINITY_DN11281_c0_g1~~TRINITY_DN11281_c0_g1_i1.p1  ORF type:complete len:657 (+),score=87.22 TRINITY_DN11281_c0_g1_i1:23-1972(+)
MPTPPLHLSSLCRQCWQHSQRMQEQLCLLADRLAAVEKALKLGVETTEAPSDRDSRQALPEENKIEQGRTVLELAAQVPNVERLLAEQWVRHDARIAKLELFMRSRDCCDEPSAAVNTTEQTAGTRGSAGTIVTQFNDFAWVASGKSQKVTSELLDEAAEDVFQFEKSAWDMCVFCGTGALGSGGSIMTCTLALMTAFAQFTMTAFAWFNFTSTLVDENLLVALRRWRVASHFFQHYDKAADQSLVAKVCSGDKALMLSNSQQGLFDFLNTYLKQHAEGFESIFVGKLLCMGAESCWFFMVVKKVHHGIDFCRAMKALPRGRTALRVAVSPIGSSYELTQLSRARFCLNALLVAFTMCVYAMLAVTGTLFLAYTVNVQDLLLNAVALDIILNIDAIMFEVMAVHRAKYWVSEVKPVSLPSLPSWRGIDTKSCSTFVALPLLLAVVYSVLLVPMVNDLEEAVHIICGGDTNFVWSHDPRNFVLMAETSPWHDAASVDGVRAQAIQEAIREGPRLEPSQADYAIWVSMVTLSHVGSASNPGLQIAESIDRDRERCEDATDRARLHYLQEIVNGSGVVDCRDALPWCRQGLLTEAICPVTCGCPFSPSSCPKRCCRFGIKDGHEESRDKSTSLPLTLVCNNDDAALPAGEGS